MSLSRSNIGKLSTRVPTSANLLPIQRTSVLLPILVKGRLRDLFDGRLHFRNYNTMSRLIAPQRCRKTPHWNSQPKWETSVQLSGKTTILKSYRINYLILFMLWTDECLGSRLEQETEAVLLTSRLIILIARNVITAKKNDSYALIHSMCQNNASVK